MSLGMMAVHITKNKRYYDLKEIRVFLMGRRHLSSQLVSAIKRLIPELYEGALPPEPLATDRRIVAAFVSQNHLPKEFREAIGRLLPDLNSALQIDLWEDGV